VPADEIVAVQAALTARNGIRATARQVGTGNATVHAIACEMRVTGLIGTDYPYRAFFDHVRHRTVNEQAAREIIERHGPDAVPIIRERAENATDLADEIAAKEWRDIADAAERILRETAK